MQEFERGVNYIILGYENKIVEICTECGCCDEEFIYPELDYPTYSNLTEFLGQEFVKIKCYEAVVPIRDYEEDQMANIYTIEIIFKQGRYKFHCRRSCRECNNMCIIADVRNIIRR